MNKSFNNYKYQISIVVVSLNSKEDFKETINSIFDQTFLNYEVVIIDANSNDGTKNEISKLKKTNTKIVIENDEGIYDAMNKGIKLADGEWTIFMNCGDIFYDRNVLNKVFSLKIENKEIIFADTIVSNNNLNYTSQGKYFSKKTILMPFCHQSSITKTNLLKKYMFEKRYKLSADFDFFLRCFLNNSSFFKFENCISKVKSGGKADISRQQVLNENLYIFIKNKQYFKILRIYIIKIYELLKSIVKYILPKFLIKIILRFKYKKDMVK